MPVGFPDYYGGLTLPVTVQEGGTGQTSFPVGSIPIGQGTSGLLASNIGTANQVFQIDPTSLLPTWKNLSVPVSSITGILPIANGGTGTSTPNLTAGAGISISGTWPNQTITNSDDTYFTSGILQIAHGGTGTSTPALVAGAGISISGSWPNQTITNSDDAYFTSGILQVPHGGTGTSTPSLVAGTGISITGSWPNQTLSVTNPLTLSASQFGNQAWDSTLNWDSAIILLNATGNGSSATFYGDGANNSGVFIGVSTGGVLDVYIPPSTGGSNQTLTSSTLAGYRRLRIDQAGLGLAGMITSYNQHTTAGGGVPAIVVQSTATGISTSSTLVSYTPPATGFYRISAYVIATASGTGSLNVFLTSLDPWTSNTQNINLIVSSSGLQISSALSGSIIVYASSSANITLKVNLGTGGPTIDVAYMIEAL